MLSKYCEKTVLISSATNQWPQNPVPVDEKFDLMDQESSTTAEGRVMEKQQQQQQQALKCPRCDSSNTKFCYYNNYSLSQPRHFCKACKRYWTRGGTLRNVPVGGGCRKNKRSHVIKRPPSAASPAAAAAASPILSQSQPQNQMDRMIMNPALFYGGGGGGLANYNPFPGFNPRVLGVGGYDHLQPPHELNINGLSPQSSYNNSNIMLGDSSSTYNSTTPTIASLLASTSFQGSQFRNSGGVKNTHQVPTFQDVLQYQMGENGLSVKDVKVEESRMMEYWNNNGEQMGVCVSDPAAVYNWNATTWHDPANIGSSVSSLI